MDYHDTNGNLVDQPSDTAEVTVYVPSELKKPKTTHYSPIFQGVGSDAPDDLVNLLGDGSYLLDKYLAVFEETLLGTHMGTSISMKLLDEQMAHDYKIIHIYMSKDPYANEPRSDNAVIVDPIEEIELPEDMTIETQIAFVTIPELESPEALPLEVPKIVVFENIESIIAPIVTETQVTPEKVIIAEPQAALVSPVTITTMPETEVSEVVEIAEIEEDITTIETKVESNEIVESEHQEVTTSDLDQTKEENIQSHDIAYTETFAEAVSKAYLNSVYITMAVVWFIVISLLAGLFIGFELRKRR